MASRSLWGWPSHWHLASSNTTVDSIQNWNWMQICHFMTIVAPPPTPPYKFLGNIHIWPHLFFLSLCDQLLGFDWTYLVKKVLSSNYLSLSLSVVVMSWRPGNKIIWSCLMLWACVCVCVCVCVCICMRMCACINVNFKSDYSDMLV